MCKRLLSLTFREIVANLVLEGNCPFLVREGDIGVWVQGKPVTVVCVLLLFDFFGLAILIDLVRHLTPLVVSICISGVSSFIVIAAEPASAALGRFSTALG